MKNQKRSRLPRGLRWKSDSPYIWFSWRDARGKQHQQSTESNDPVKAFAFRTQFMAKRKDYEKRVECQSPEMGKLPLRRVAEFYFSWKTANCSAETVAREKRIFKSVEKFFGSRFPTNGIGLHHIRDYQRERREQISPTMKQPVTARTVNYEMHLLRSAMTFAGCWMPELEVGYQPLREIKQRAGKVATKDQLVTIITEAMANEYWQLAVYCAAVVAGTGCRGGEIRIFSLGTLIWTEARSASSARLQRTARSASLGSWHLRIGGCVSSCSGRKLWVQPNRSTTCRL